jgi:hypothetical protein
MEIQMTNLFWTVERRARYLMSIVSLVLLAGVVLFNLGWISTTPSYNSQAWYSFNEQAGFVVMTEHADEAGCRSSEKPPSVVCRSGKSLTAN